VFVLALKIWMTTFCVKKGESIYVYEISYSNSVDYELAFDSDDEQKIVQMPRQKIIPEESD
jgi:hypothetical protein